MIIGLVIYLKLLKAFQAKKAVKGMGQVIRNIYYLNILKAHGDKSVKPYFLCKTFTTT